MTEKNEKKEFLNKTLLKKDAILGLQDFFEWDDSYIRENMPNLYFADDKTEVSVSNYRLKVSEAGDKKDCLRVRKVPPSSDYGYFDYMVLTDPYDEKGFGKVVLKEEIGFGQNDPNKRKVSDTVSDPFLDILAADEIAGDVHEDVEDLVRFDPIGNLRQLKFNQPKKSSGKAPIVAKISNLYEDGTIIDNTRKNSDTASGF